MLRQHFTRWAVMLDPELGAVMPAGDGVADGLEAVVVAARAWVLRFGPVEFGSVVSRLSGGLLLATRVPAFCWG